MAPTEIYPHQHTLSLHDALPIWPYKWPLSYLNDIKHTRSYKKNFLNQPVRMDGDYWVESDFQYGDVPHPTHVLLQIDPATTSKTSSDYYGVAVIAFDRSEEHTSELQVNHAQLVFRPMLEK